MEFRSAILTSTGAASSALLHWGGCYLLLAFAIRTTLAVVATLASLVAGSYLLAFAVRATLAVITTCASLVALLRRGGRVMSVKVVTNTIVFGLCYEREEYGG